MAQNYDPTVFSPFFGNERGAFFVRANYRDSFDTPLFNHCNSEDIKYDSITELMKVRNYADKQGLPEDDIHPEFVNFIINTGIWHRELDAKSGEGDINRITKSLKDLLAGYFLATQNYYKDIDAIINGDVDKLRVLEILEDEVYNSTPGAQENFKRNAITVNILQPDIGKIINDYVYIGNKWKQTYNEFKNICKNQDQKCADAVVLLPKLILRELTSVDFPSDIANHPTNVADYLYGQFDADFSYGQLNQVTRKITREMKHESDFSLFNNVYSKWGELGRTERDFYKTFIELIDDNYNNERKQKVLKNENNEIYHKNLQSVIDAGVRFNLKPSLENRNRSNLFSTTLPLICRTSTVHFVDATGDMVNIENPNEDILRDIYDAAYLNKPYKTHQLARVAQSHGTFNLNKAAFMRNYIAANNKHKTKNISLNNYNQVFEHLPTKNIYQRDGKGLYKKVNGQNVYFTTEVEEGQKCFTTGVNQDKCMKLIECIGLDGNLAGLGKCMDVLKDKDMFRVAVEDVQNVAPEMIVKFMKKFSIKKKQSARSDGTIFYLPMSFEEWRRDILDKNSDKDVITAIIENKNLCEYIKGLIAVLKRNPKIINQNLRDNVETDDSHAPESYVSIGIDRRYNPHKRNAKENIMLTGCHMDALAQQNKILLEKPVRPFMPLANAYLGYGSNPFAANGVMVGGCHQNKHNAAFTYKQLFVDLHKQLGALGMELSTEDQTRIMVGIKSVDDIEGQLGETFHTLCRYLHLSTLFDDECLRGPVIDIESAKQCMGDFTDKQIKAEIMKHKDNYYNLNHQQLKDIYKFERYYATLAQKLYPEMKLKNNKNRYVDMDFNI